MSRQRANPPTDLFPDHIRNQRANWRFRNSDDDLPRVLSYIACGAAIACLQWRLFNGLPRRFGIVPAAATDPPSSGQNAGASHAEFKAKLEHGLEETSHVQENLAIMKTFAIFHPGEMGAALGAALASRGLRGLWASNGRSAQTAARAKAAGLEDVHSIERAVQAAEVAVSVCPPDAALALARDVAADGFRGIYIDANAISPATAREIGSVIEAAGGTFVDGGIIGLPPTPQKQPTLYLCGAQAAAIAALFSGTNIHAQVIDGEAGTASALKMCYAAFTKGTTALLAAVRSLAEYEGVERPLLEAWRRTLPDVPRQSEFAATAASKAWRWSGEMQEIAASFRAAGLPEGFHLAAADVYRRLEGFKNRVTPPSMAEVIQAMQRAAPAEPARVAPDVHVRVTAKTPR